MIFLIQMTTINASLNHYKIVLQRKSKLFFNVIHILAKNVIQSNVFLYFYRFQKSVTLPLQSPSSDSGISLERSPSLTKSSFVICKLSLRNISII